jgi:hypothetical protein
MVAVQNQFLRWKSVGKRSVEAIVDKVFVLLHGMSKLHVICSAVQCIFGCIICEIIIGAMHAKKFNTF